MRVTAQVSLRGISDEIYERRVRKTTRRVALDDALRSHTRLMVVGDPGAGKSTLLRYLALTAASATKDESRRTEGINRSSSVLRQELGLPILIPLRRFAASAQSLVEFFYTYAKQTSQLDLPCGFFERALDAGRGLLLLDGLDEVVSSDQRVAVRDAVGGKQEAGSRKREKSQNLRRKNESDPNAILPQSTRRTQ